MEPTVFDYIYFIDLEFWVFVNEIFTIEAWTSGAIYSIG